MRSLAARCLSAVAPFAGPVAGSLGLAPLLTLLSVISGLAACNNEASGVLQSPLRGRGRGNPLTLGVLMQPALC